MLCPRHRFPVVNVVVTTEWTVRVCCSLPDVHVVVTTQWTVCVFAAPSPSSTSLLNRSGLRDVSVRVACRVSALSRVGVDHEHCCVDFLNATANGQHFS